MPLHKNDNDVMGYNAPKILAAKLPISTISDTEAGLTKIKGRLKLVQIRPTDKPGLFLYEANITDKSGTLRAIWYNSRYIKYVSSNKEYIFLGEIQLRHGVKTIVSAIFTTPEEIVSWSKRLK